MGTGPIAGIGSGLQVGDPYGTIFNKIKLYQQAVASTGVPGLSVNWQTYTVTGLSSDDLLLSVQYDASTQTGLGIVGWNSSANSIQIGWAALNGTSTALITPSSGNPVTCLVANVYVL